MSQIRGAPKNGWVETHCETKSLSMVVSCIPVVGGVLAADCWVRVKARGLDPNGCFLFKPR